LSHARKLTPALLAACLVAALAVAAPASAAEGATPQANIAAKKVSKKAFNKRAKKIEKSVRAVNKLVDGIAEIMNSHNNQITNIFGVLQNDIAPGLTKLGDAALQLKAGLEQAGAGLVQLKGAVTQLATSQEYGVVRVFAGTTALPLSSTSGDIPDDGNTASAGGVLPIVVGTNIAGGQLPGGTPLALRAAIRSGENGDGDATGDPAGQVGGLLTLRCAAPDGECDLDPTAGTQNVPTGAIVCSVGPPPTQAFNLPDGTTVNQPLKVIQQAAARTDQTRPNATDTNVVSGGAATGTGSSTNGTCSVGDDDLIAPGAPADVYELTLQVQFVDLPTSMTPDLDD
jgi:hypothetical protein